MNAPVANQTATKITITCDRCEGKGYINGMGHYANGVCFLCAGAGQRKVTPYVQKITAEMEAAAAKANAEEKVVCAFIEAHLHLSKDQVVKKLSALSFEKVYRLHSVVCGVVRQGNDDARPMLAACKVLLERFIIED